MNAKEIVESMDKFIQDLEIRDSRLLLNPFFWLIRRRVSKTDGNIFFGEPRAKWGSIKHTGQVLLQGIRNMRRLACRAKDCLKFCIVNREIPKIVYGEIEPGTQIVISTWLLEKDFNRFLDNAYDYVWNDLKKELSTKGYKIQIIVTLLFEARKKEIQRLVESDIVVMNSGVFLSLFELAKGIKIALCAGAKIIKHFKTPSIILSYVNSFIRLEYMQAIALDNTMGKMLRGKRCDLLVPWEGQPLHRALCRAFQVAGNHAFGYIHGLETTMAMFSRISGNRYSELFPEKLFVHGGDMVPMLEDVGWNKGDIIRVKSQRYKRRLPSEFTGTLYLPYSMGMALEILEVVEKMVKDGTLQVGKIRPHPCYENSTKTNKRIDEIPKQVDARNVLVGGFSTIIMEALEAGCIVIQIATNETDRLDEYSYRSIIKEYAGKGVSRLTLPEESRGNLICYEGRPSISDYFPAVS